MKILKITFCMILLLFVVGCNHGILKEQQLDNENKNKNVTIGKQDHPASTAEIEQDLKEKNLLESENEFTFWLPKGTELYLAQKEHLPDLAEVIAQTYDIPKDEWKNTRYYYDYVDLNEDGEDEIIAVVMGMYTSGTGGDSAIIVQPYAGMNVIQKFTLVRMPIFISDKTTDGVHDLILLRSGGGNEPEFIHLTSTDGVYNNPADAEILKNLDGEKGIGILCNDIVEDLNSGSYLSLDGKNKN